MPGPTRSKKPATKRTRVSAAERKRRETQASTAKPPDADESKPVDGLVILRLPAGDGVNFGTSVRCVGDVRATEIGDLLALALRNHRKHTDPE